MSAVDDEVRAHLLRVRERMAEACRRAGRPQDAVRLLAVSKRQPLDKLRAAYAAGQRELGENYVQELQQKAQALRDLPDLRFRFIGHLQRNKAKHVAALGCAVDSVDSAALAHALSAQAQSAGRRLQVMLQVNIDQEPQKAGVTPAGAEALACEVAQLPGLELTGLMAIPATHDDPEGMRPAFRRLRLLGQRLGLPELSMGMSADLEVAIEEGSTMVRVGTAVFGPRG